MAAYGVGFSISVYSFATVVKGAEKMIRFVADGRNNLFIGGYGVKHNKGIIRFVFVAFVNGFSQSGKIAVLVKRRSFANIDGGVFGSFRAFGYKNNILISITRVKFSDNIGNAFFCQRGILYFHIVNG